MIWFLIGSAILGLMLFFVLSLKQENNMPFDEDKDK